MVDVIDKPRVHFVDLAKAGLDMPKATDPRTREGLHWTMGRSLTEAVNVCKILDLTDLQVALEAAADSADRRRQRELAAAGIEPLR